MARRNCQTELALKCVFIRFTMFIKLKVVPKYQTSRSNISVKELKQQHGRIYQIMIRNLCDKCQSGGEITHPSIYLSLTLLSVLYPGFEDDDEDYRESLWQLLSSKLSKVRAVTARVITVACTEKTQKSFFCRIFSELKSITNQNRVNGILLFATELVKISPDVISKKYFLSNALLPFRKLALPSQYLVLNPIVESFLNYFDSNALTDILASYKSTIFPEQIFVEKLLLFYYTIERYSDLVDLIIKRKFVPQSIIECMDTAGVPARFLDALTLQQDWVQPLCDKAFEQADSSFIFLILNSCEFTMNDHSDLFLSKIFKYLESSRSCGIGYINLVVILSVLYGYNFNDTRDIKTFLQLGHSFKLKSMKAYETLLSIRSIPHVSDISICLVVMAMIQCQSEDENIQPLAVRFCQRLSVSCDSSADVPVTPLKAMMLALEYLSHDDSSRAVLEDVKTKIRSNSGDLNNEVNAHFSKAMILNLLS